ncbi:hypothetical protein O3M35_005112 [Rhynocoris fuscipes]|uniref:Probable ATP-dependent RNA helicase spindle-E n=1 Tax=Rhynocoris fuscipes TaxID=488301 RepID=A0AAW1DKS7_9HEMI
MDQTPNIQKAKEAGASSFSSKLGRHMRKLALSSLESNVIRPSEEEVSNQQSKINDKTEIDHKQSEALNLKITISRDGKREIIESSTLPNQLCSEETSLSSDTSANISNLDSSNERETSNDELKVEAESGRHKKKLSGKIHRDIRIQHKTQDPFTSNNALTSTCTSDSEPKDTKENVSHHHTKKAIRGRSTFSTKNSLFDKTSSDKDEKINTEQNSSSNEPVDRDAVSKVDSDSQNIGISSDLQVASPKKDSAFGNNGSVRNEKNTSSNEPFQLSSTQALRSSIDREILNKVGSNDSNSQNIGISSDLPAASLEKDSACVDKDILNKVSTDCSDSFITNIKSGLEATSPRGISPDKQLPNLPSTTTVKSMGRGYVFSKILGSLYDSHSKKFTCSKSGGVDEEETISKQKSNDETSFAHKESISDNRTDTVNSSNNFARDVLNKVSSSNLDSENTSQSPDLQATFQESISSNIKLPNLSSTATVKSMGRGYIFNKILGNHDTRVTTRTESSSVDQEKTAIKPNHGELVPENKTDLPSSSNTLNKVDSNDSVSLNIQKCFGRGRKICSPEKNFRDSLKLQLSHKEINQTKVEEVSSLTSPISDGPEDTSSILSNKTNLPLLNPDSLLGRVLGKIVKGDTMEQTPASMKTNQSFDEKSASTICEDDFSETKTDIDKKTFTSHRNVQESESERLVEQVTKPVDETFSSANELDKQNDIGEQDDNLGNISYDSSISSVSEQLLPRSKYVEEGSTSTSDFNKYSDDESPVCYNDETRSKLQTTGSILHGDVPINTVSKVNDLQVHNLIMKNLEYKRITDLTRCQMVSIPVVAEKRNFVLIGPPRSKKTSAWLIPILNHLLYDEQTEPKKSPKCIVIVPGSQRVRQIARLCSAYVGAKLTTIGTHGGGLELERKDELLSGVDILISTPRCCLRLFRSKYVISSDRLRYFVIDNAHDVLTRFSPEMNLLKSGLDYLTQVREKFNEDSSLQTILVSTMWTKEIENISLNWMKMPVICFTSFLEAAIYSRINLNLHIVRINDKVTKLFDMICKNNITRTVIVCNCSEETKQLRAKLSTLPRVVIVAHEDMLPTLLPGVQDAWNKAESVPLLICTDFVTSDLNISNAKWLIHYSVPTNKTNFRDRFKFIKDYFIDRIKNKDIEKPNCKADIFIDESTEHLFPKMVELLDRLEQPVSDDWRFQAKEIEKRIEMEKVDTLFCENIFQFAQCWKVSCKQRHVIDSSKDAPKLEPAIKSFVEVHVLDVISPTHLIVRIKSHSKKLFSDKIEVKSNYLYIALKLAEFYAEKENRCRHGRTIIGDVVGVAIKDSFARAKVVNIISRDKKSNAIEVELYLLDKGTYLTENVENLFSLPVELRGLPDEAVNVYITGLVPLDLDHSWSHTAIKYISKRIMELQYDESREIMIIGQVELVIGTTLLLDKLLFYEEPPKGCTSPWLIESLRQLIISSNYGILNPGYKIILSKLAEEAGIETPKDLCKVNLLPKKKQKEECRWAHLLSDEEYFVNIIVAEDIKTFFVRPTKFLHSLKQLEKDLNDQMKKNSVILEEFNVGTVCCAKVPDEDNFNRGIIIEPHEKEPLNDSEVELLFVDYGDRVVLEKSELFELPEGFVARLPFQAVECGLAGIDPISSEEVSKVAVNRLYEITSDKDGYSSIFLKVIKCAGKAEFTGGSLYDVVLIDKNDDKFVLINEEMVKLGFAHWNDETKDVVLSFKKRETEKPKSESLIECKNKSTDVAEKPLSLATVTSPSADTLNDSVFEIMNEKFDINDFEVVGNFYNEMFKKMFGGAQMNTDQLDVENTSLVSKDSSVVIKEIDSECEENLETNSDQNTNLHLEDLSESEDDFVDDNVCNLKRISVYSPTVHWRQSPTYVWIKVLLPDVKQFKLFWSMSYVNFHTMIDDKLYWVDIDLFGSINPDTVMHKVTGLYFEVRLTKLLRGFSWPRIFYSNVKLRNVIHDPDKVSLDEDDEKEDLSLIPSYVERSEEISKQSTTTKKHTNLYTKFNYHALEDNSGSSGESDIDDFFPVPEAVENLYED